MSKKEKIFRCLFGEKKSIFAIPFSFWWIALADSSEKIGSATLKIVKALGRIARMIIVGCVVLFIRCIYRTLILPWLHGDCRFHPTCSEYCIQAFQNLPLWHATILVIWRIARCHPWGKCGEDPVPPSLFSSS
jgi:putative membrane protein insertion efficiency factor